MKSIRVASEVCLLTESGRGIDLDETFRRIGEAAGVEALHLWGARWLEKGELRVHLLASWVGMQHRPGGLPWMPHCAKDPTVRARFLESIRSGEMVDSSDLWGTGPGVDTVSTSLLFVPIGAGQELKGLLGIQGLVAQEVTREKRDNWVRTLANLVGAVFSADRTRRALEESQDLLHSVFDSMSSGVLVTSSEGTVLLVNPAAASYLGVSPEGLLGRNLYKELPGAKGLLEHTAPGEQRSAEVGLPDGRAITIGFTSARLSHRGYHVTVFRDTTPILENQRRRRRAEQLAQVGEMAARLAHEIKNPLASVMAGLELIETQSFLSYSQNAILQSVMDEARAVSHVIGDLLRSSRPASLVPKIVRLGRTLYDMLVPLLEFASRHGVDIEVSPPTRDVYVAVSVEALGRVVRNLVVNAVEACSGGGRVDVSWRTLTREEREASFPHAQEDVVAVQVRDNGEGIPKDKLNGIFEPFATSKEKGTGLGLAVAADIVESHGGLISVDSAPRQGTTFTIHLVAGRRPHCWEAQNECLSECESCTVHGTSRGYLCWATIGDSALAETHHWPEMCRRCPFFNKYNLGGTCRCPESSGSRLKS